MKTQYELSIGGLGHFIVDVNVCRIDGVESDLECEVEVIGVKKFDDSLEEYVDYKTPHDELLILEQQVAVKFFSQLHWGLYETFF